MSNPISAETIALIKSFGFDVYMRSPKDSWLYFTDGKRIGYLQNDFGGGYSLSTVHKPNISTGTGFDVGRNIYDLSKEVLERAFMFAPSWSYDHHTIVKYPDMHAFIAANQFNKEYKPV